MKNLIKKYLKRLGVEEQTDANLSFLKKLQTHHLLNIPFENLNIHYGIKIETTKKALEVKILDKNRGGFCYELNGAFSFLLKDLGFDVTLLSARVINEKGIVGREFDHLTLFIKLEKENYLVDVGFGEAFFEPLKFKVDEVQTQFGRAFKIIQLAENQFKLLKSNDCKNFSVKYLFSLTPRKLSDFEGMCNFHQTSPDSTFTNKVICTKATQNGRISLTGSKFNETKNDIKTETDVKDENEFRKFLKQKFQIEMNLNAK